MNGSNDHILALRIRRLRAACGDIRWQESAALAASGLSQRPWIALSCSRLGNDAALQAEICRFLSRSTLDCRSRDAVVVVAEGSAVEPWAVRAAELFGVNTVRVSIGQPKHPDTLPRLVLEGSADTVSRDAAIVALADRVDALYVRDGGTIFRCLQQRLLTLRDVSTRVAVITTKPSAARKLIAQGAIGWLVQTNRKRASCEQLAAHPVSESLPAATPEKQIQIDPAWTRSDGEWLVHCTRSCVGPWPGQTPHQYQDALLLGPQPPQQRTPLDTLRQILRSGRLLANAIASAKAWPVVCCSAVPLRELLDRRCFRPHLRRWDYEPYGIAIRRRLANQVGLQPVIYGDPEQRAQYADEQQFRFQAIGRTYDWRGEREWRAPRDIDLNQLQAKDLRVFVPTFREAQALAQAYAREVDVVPLASKSGQQPVAE